MYKQSPSRNNRSKGIKVKHILQICVLLAVCLWLIYQVKHSHEKRREFEVKGEKIVGKIENDGEIQRIGRKDIPKISELGKDGEKHEEDEDEKEGEEEEETKHEEDETEKEDVRIVDTDEERGGGDDEIDEHEPEKIETETDHEEEEKEEKEDVNGEKHIENEETEDVHEEEHPEEEEDSHTKPEENEDVDNEDRNEQEVIVSDPDEDQVVSRTNTREAQEELYKADDASSEVAQNVQSISSETENVTTGHENKMWGKVNFGQDHETKTSELVKPEVQTREDVNGGTLNTTITEQIKDDNSHQNSTLPEIATDATQMAQNGTGEKEQNLTGNVLEHTVQLTATNDKNLQEGKPDDIKAQNVTTQASSHATNDHDTLETTKDNLAETHEEKQEKNDHNALETTKDNLVETHEEKQEKNDHDALETTKDSSVGYEKQENSGKHGVDESSEAHSDEGTDVIQHDPIDASDTTTLTQGERESRTDLDTLPEIRTEIQNNKDAATE